jgi:hypothetical protein
MPVLVGPGQTALTRMPSWATSRAIALARLMTAALEALYDQPLGSPARPDVDPVTTIEPPSTRRSAGNAARMPSTTARTFTSMTRSKRSTGSRSTRPKPGMPALRNTPWRAPNDSVAARTISSLVSSRVTSPVTPTTRSTPAVHRRASAARSTATNEAPSAWRRSTVARPMPEAAPVTA